MLRALAILVIVANGLFWGYTNGWFDGWFGLSSRGDREPERLARQVRPELVRILPAASAGADGREAGCFEAGPVPAADAWAAELALSNALPTGSWRDVRVESQASGVPATRLYRVTGADVAMAARLASLSLVGDRYPFRACTGAR